MNAPRSDTEHLRLLLDRPIPIEQVRAECIGLFDVSDQIASEAERAFRERSLKNPTLFDGKLARLSRISLCKGEVSLTLEETQYSVYVSTRSGTLANTFRANPLGVTALVVTSDGKLVVTRRSAHADQNPSAAYFVGGYVEPPIHGSRVSMFDECARELNEELGLQADMLEKILLLGIEYDTQFYHPEAFVLCKSSVPSKELDKLWRTAKDRDESQSIAAVELSDEYQVCGEIRSPYSWSYTVGLQLLRNVIRPENELI